jgi:hypothetical protein
VVGVADTGHEGVADEAHAKVAGHDSILPRTIARTSRQGEGCLLRTALLSTGDREAAVGLAAHVGVRVLAAR